MRERVYVASPLGADNQAGLDANIEFAKSCNRAVLRAGYIPFSPHVYYPALGLDDLNPADRKAGMEAGFEELRGRDMLFWFLPPWRVQPSEGMLKEFVLAGELGVPVHRCELKPAGELIVHPAHAWNTLRAALNTTQEAA